MQPSIPYSRGNQFQSLGINSNEKPSVQAVGKNNLLLSDPPRTITLSRPSDNVNRSVQTKWKKQTNNDQCIKINISRELKMEEMELIQVIASSLDSSFRLSYSPDEERIIVVVYGNNVPSSVLSAVRTLILGIDRVYKSYNTVNSSSAKEDSRSQMLSQCSDNEKVNVVNSLPPSSDKSPSSELSPTIDQSMEGEEGVETPDVFERPLSLKGQRHVFLYKCRYSQLKSIIDKSGCWGLRMASLEDKWPCLVVYCAKDRESWMNAFRKIQRLERNDFLRKKVSDSMKTVDLKRLEELTQSYGQKNACISLCVQSPSSPQNPSVSVCGIESYVEQLFKIFVEYHLVSDDLADNSVSVNQPSILESRSNTTMFNSVIQPVYTPPQSNNVYYSNDIFFPIGNHPLYTPYSPTGFTTQGMGNDIHDDYNTTFNNPHFDNFPYSQIRQEPSHSLQREYDLKSNQYSLQDRFYDNQYFLDNEHYFPSSSSQFFTDFDNQLFSNRGFASDQKENHSESSRSSLVNTDEKSVTPPKDFSRLGSSGYKEFFPSTPPPRSTERPKPVENRENSSERVAEKPMQLKEKETSPLSTVQSSPKSLREEVPSLTSWNGKSTATSYMSRLRHRDDNFELFMDSNAFPDSMIDTMSSGLSFNSQWRDDGW